MIKIKIIMLMKIIHWIVIAFAPLDILLGGSEKFYDAILALLILIPMHWSFFNNECCISYLHKKTKDCSRH